jgi:hypothetical protein
MRTRIAAILIAGLAVAGALSTAGVASAKHGADDSGSNGSHSHGADDPSGHTSHSSGGPEDSAGHDTGGYYGTGPAQP